MAAPTSTNEVTARRLTRLLVGSDGNGGLWKKLNAKFDNRIDRYDAIYDRSYNDGNGWVKLAETPSIANPKQVDFPYVWDVIITRCQGETSTEQLCMNVRYETSGAPSIMFKRFYTIDRLNTHKFSIVVTGAGGTGTGKIELWGFLEKFWGSIAIREVAGNTTTSLYTTTPKPCCTYYSYTSNGGGTKPVEDIANNIRVVDSTNIKVATSSDVSSAIGALDVASVGGAGKYISAISETAGKISATATTMDTTPTASSTNAVTSGGVKTALDGKAPTSHASSATTYGVGTTANYGHVKLATGDMNGAAHSDGVAVSKNHTHSQYLSKEGGSMTGATRGYFLSTRDSMVGNEYNCLINAKERGALTFTQSGTGQLTEDQVWQLFDGRIVPSYSSTGIDPSDPYVLTIDATKTIGNTHTQAFAAFGWTTRYWCPVKFKVEAYNTWESKNEWVTLADYSTTAYSGQYSAGIANLFIPFGSGRANPHTGVTQSGAFPKIRITIYQGDTSTTPANRWGISEIFYCYPEVYKLYSGLHVHAADRVNATVYAGYTSDLVNASVANSDFARIRVGGENNAGYMEIATGDDGTEPIYVRQYTGANVTNQVTLLDGSGNTTFPKQVTAAGFTGPLTGNADTATSTSQVAHSGPATADMARHVWFSDSATEAKRVYNDSFKYNPVGNLLTANISGNAATATKATQDSDGNAINTTYFKSSGNTTLVAGAATKIGTQNGADVKLTITAMTDQEVTDLLGAMTA